MVHFAYRHRIFRRNAPGHAAGKFRNLIRESDHIPCMCQHVHPCISCGFLQLFPADRNLLLFTQGGQNLGKFAHKKRLAHTVVRAGFQAFFHLDVGSFCCQGNNGHRRPASRFDPPDFLCGGNAVYPWHHNIHQDRVRPVPGDNPVDRSLSGSGFRHRRAFPFEHFPVNLPCQIVIIHQQHPQTVQFLCTVYGSGNHHIRAFRVLCQFFEDLPAAAEAVHQFFAERAALPAQDHMEGFVHAERRFVNPLRCQRVKAVCY